MHISHWKRCFVHFYPQIFACHDEIACKGNVIDSTHQYYHLTYNNIDVSKVCPFMFLAQPLPVLNNDNVFFGVIIVCLPWSKNYKYINTNSIESCCSSLDYSWISGIDLCPRLKIIKAKNFECQDGSVQMKYKIFDKHLVQLRYHLMHNTKEISYPRCIALIVRNITHQFSCTSIWHVSLMLEVFMALYNYNNNIPF